MIGRIGRMGPMGLMSGAPDAGVNGCRGRLTESAGEPAKTDALVSIYHRRLLRADGADNNEREGRWPLGVMM